MEVAPTESGEITIDTDTIVEFHITSSGNYLFTVHKYDGDSITNNAKAALVISKKETKPVTFLFSSRLITVDATTTPATVKADDPYLRGAVEAVIHGLTDEKKIAQAKALQEWVNHNQDQIANLINDILEDDPSFTPYDNSLEAASFSQAILEATLTANAGQGDLMPDDRSVTLIAAFAKDIRYLASLMYADDDIQALNIFSDYQDALQKLTSMIFHIVDEQKSSRSGS
jgi:hypothetical protein